MNELANLTAAFKRHFECYPILGLEIEFYLRVVSVAIQSEASSMNLVFQQACAGYGLAITEERGINQFEITFEPDSPEHVLATYVTQLEKLHQLATQQGLVVDFSPKPYADDYGSALHLHISLHAEDKQNIFAAGRNLSENQWLMHSIGGIMQAVPAYLEKFCSSADYARFQPQFMAPSHFAWGGNNRTTIIRIPDAKPEQRRIEFRLPSADAPLRDVIIFTLDSILQGLQRRINPPARVYGNAFDPQYNLPTLKPL